MKSTILIMMINSLMHGFEHIEEGHISLAVSRDGGHIVMEYQDDGKGMSKEALTHLFDAFYTTRRNQGGSGLGTHIVFNLVTRTLDGSIEAFSEPEKGLRYVIRFPDKHA